MAPLVIDGIEWWATEAAGKVAVDFEGDSITYAELDEWAGRVAADLAARGAAPGERVGIQAGNCIEYCVAVVAIVKAGAVVVPMSTRLTERELGVLTASSEPVVLLGDEELAALGALREGEPAGFARPGVDPAAPAALIYTSGTTGEPKGVIFTNETLLGFMQEWALTESGFRHDMRQIMVLPLGGAPGTIWGILHAFFRGATLFLKRQFEPAATLEALEQDRITVMLGVPLLYEAMAAQPGFAGADLSSWDTGHVGGARVSGALLQAYQDKGVLLRQIYGMTEAGGSATCNSRENALAHPEHCGRGNMFTKIRVVRDDGSDCDPGEPGEIIMKGPSITPGYWRNDEATKATIVDGWLHSGDIGALDERGYLRMIDRKKDLIISGGLNISPIEIENAIVELPEIEEVAVIAAEDEKFGETPAAVIRLRGELTPEQLVAHCDATLSDFKVPRYVIVADEPLPRMASGKIAKRILREQHPDIARHHEKVR